MIKCDVDGSGVVYIAVTEQLWRVVVLSDIYIVVDYWYIHGISSVCVCVQLCILNEFNKSFNTLSIPLC